MKLTGQIEIYGPYPDNTGIKFWKNLQRGDIVEASTEIKSTSGGRGVYATYVNLENKRTGDKWVGSMQEVHNKLKKYHTTNDKGRPVLQRQSHRPGAEVQRG